MKKRDLIEKAIRELDPEIVERNMDASGIRRRMLTRRIAALAAAAVLLLGVGIFMKNDLIVPLPSGTEQLTDAGIQVTDAEIQGTGAGIENTFQPGGSGNYSAALAKYPELPEAERLLKLQQELKALTDGEPGMDEQAKQEAQRLLQEYEICKETLRQEIGKLRNGETPADYHGAFESCTKMLADRILMENSSENIVCSPADLYLSLCMLAKITEGESRDEVLNLLGLKAAAEAQTAANTVWRNLYREDAGGKTIPANSVWMNEGYPYRTEAVSDLASWYYADCYSAPMGNTETDDAVKGWLNMRTGHLLQAAADQLKTDRNTVVLLISALYYSDTWWNHFNTELTEKAAFTGASGTTVRTDFMHAEDTARYYRKEGQYTLAALPMVSGASMVFLLPDESTSLQELVEKETVAEGLLQWEKQAEFQEGRIRWSVPKFDTGSEISAIETLKSLGVNAVFDPAKADFSPLFDKEIDAMLSVSRIRHARRVRIDEEGCEAAAYTYIEISYTGYPAGSDNVIRMDLNRPFAFMITGIDGLPLMIGLINEL